MARPSRSTESIPGYRTVCTVLGVLYVLMASSALVRGPEALVDFGVTAETVADPVLRDFFSFLYQLMAFVGVVMVAVGWTVRARRDQVVIAVLFCVANVLSAVRDLSTSDSALGNRLYEGDATLFFVAVGLAYATVFGVVAWRGWRMESPYPAVASDDS